MFCSNCGQEMLLNQNFCPNCGSTMQKSNSVAADYKLKEVCDSISQRELIAGIIWIVIAVMQILVAFTLNFWFVILGAWNLYAGISRIKQSKRVLNPYPELVSQYENSMTGIIINMVINFFLSIIGVAGAIFDLTIRSYVLKNREILENAVARNQA